MRKYLSRVALVAVMAVAIAACADLQVDNLNAPDRERAISEPGDLQGLVQGAYSNWALITMWRSMMPLHVMSEWGAGTVGNWWVWMGGNRPGLEFPNAPTAPGDVREVLEWTWEDLYASLSNANTVLQALESGISVGSAAEDQALRASAHLIQGLALGHLGLFFDQAYILDASYRPEEGFADFSPYGDVIEAAVSMLEQSKTAADAAIAGGASFPSGLIPGGITLEYSKQLASSFQAKFLAMSPRTGAENGQVNWARVAQIAAQGIQADFAPESDGANWQAQSLRYLSVDWYRPNLRIISMMDPTYPEDWPEGEETLPPPTSADARMGTDYEYVPTWGTFNPARGAFKRSNVMYVRFDYHNWAGAPAGPVPYMLKAESDLILAEALIRSNGSLEEAARLINITRVGRGQLEPVSAGDGAEALLAAAKYEFDIDVAVSGTLSVPFFNARRWDVLKTGVARQFPVPASELNIIGHPLYSFGGTN